MKTPSPVNSSSSVAALVAILLVFIGQPYQQIHAFQHHHHAIFTSPSYSSQSHRSLSQGKLSSAAYFNFIPQVVLTERRDRRLHLSSEPATTANEVLNIDQLITKANEYLEEVQGLISSSDSLNELEVFRVGYLGKNGKITAMMKDMRNLPKEVKPKLGEVVNRVSKEIEELLKVKKEELTIISAQLEAAQMYLGSLATVPTLPLLATTPGRRHPLSLVMDLACEIFENIGYEIIIGSEDSPEIENDFYNFEALGMPKDHPARDMQDTFYINTTGIDTNETLLLRTHTSAVQIREMQKRTPPFKIVVPGRVYRKDDVDATHYPIFHQVELLAIDEIGKLNMADLLGTVKYFLEKMFGKGIEVKYRSSYFPFTEPSIEVDIYFRGKWLEVLGCGMVDPVVLQSVGYDPEKYAGFAAGFGVERFAMIMHNITDIRNFWNNDLEFLEQFPSLPYTTNDEDDEEPVPNDIDSIYAKDEDSVDWFSGM